MRSLVKGKHPNVAESPLREETARRNLVLLKKSLEKCFKAQIFNTA
jgi:hypothetical protein